ncbi:MAG TPA: hypothetical protein VM253_07090 [Candidatus Limnocylindrales bacterium]|nr:hypothetical protein [Candidatus Limnocylindrales bacterium]
MAGMLWVTDREPGIRVLFAELLPEAEVLTPDELEARLAVGQRPDAMVVDGTQLLELAPEQRRRVLELPRVLICTGMLLASMPMNLISGPGVAVLAKPFCVEDLEAAIEWVRGVPSPLAPDQVPFGALVQRRRPRQPRGRLPSR